MPGRVSRFRILDCAGAPLLNMEAILTSSLSGALPWAVGGLLIAAGFGIRQYFGQKSHNQNTNHQLKNLTERVQVIESNKVDRRVEMLEGWKNEHDAETGDLGRELRQGLKLLAEEMRESNRIAREEMQEFRLEMAQRHADGNERLARVETKIDRNNGGNNP